MSDARDILEELDSPTLHGAYRDEILLRRRAAAEIRRLRAENALLKPDVPAASFD